MKVELKIQRYKPDSLLSVEEILTKRQLTQISSAFHHLGVKLAVAFGSRISGKPHAHSDLDVAVLLRPQSQWTLYKVSRIREIIRKNTAISEVDIVPLDKADPLLLGKIFSSAKLIFGNKKDFHSFCLNSFHKYQDFKPYLRQEEKAVHQFVFGNG